RAIETETPAPSDRTATTKNPCCRRGKEHPRERSLGAIFPRATGSAGVRGQVAGGRAHGQDRRLNYRIPSLAGAGLAPILARACFWARCYCHFFATKRPQMGRKWLRGGQNPLTKIRACHA